MPDDITVPDDELDERLWQLYRQGMHIWSIVSTDRGYVVRVTRRTELRDGA